MEPSGTETEKEQQPNADPLLFKRTIATFDDKNSTGNKEN
jgi:hypothetical protein